MTKTTFGLLALSACLLATILPHAQAADRIQPSDEVPDITLTDYEGNEHTLSDHRGKIVVLVFTSPACPWSRGVDPQLIELANEFKEKDVVFYGIDADRDNTIEEIAAHAKAAEIPFPILKDVDNVYADKLHAVSTPEVFIVDTNGVLAYHGAFDNRVSPMEAGDTPHAKNALTELVAGKKISTPKVSAWGCTIKRVPKRPQQVEGQ